MKKYLIMIGYVLLSLVLAGIMLLFGLAINHIMFN